MDPSLRINGGDKERAAVKGPSESSGADESAAELLQLTGDNQIHRERLDWQQQNLETHAVRFETAVSHDAMLACFIIVGFVILLIVAESSVERKERKKKLHLC